MINVTLNRKDVVGVLEDGTLTIKLRNGDVSVNDDDDCKPIV